MTRLASLAALCALVFVVLAAPRNAPVPAQSGAPHPANPTAGLTLGLVSEPATGTVPGGAPLMLAAATPESALTEWSRPAVTQPVAGSSGPTPTPAPFERTAISAGPASWFAASGDQGAVPWWRPGQDSVLAVVNAYHDGMAFSVTIWITGFCQCLVGTERERLIDLSLGAFAQLADPAQGLVRVQLEIPTQGAVTGGRP